EAVQDHPGVGVPPQLDDDAHAAAVRFVPQIADALNGLVPVQLGDLLDQVGLVDLIRQLGDDDALPPVGHLLDAGLAPHFDAAAAGGVRLFDAVAPQNLRARGKVGPAHDAHQLFRGHVGIFDKLDE